MSETTDKPELGWCVIELMGHRRLAGKVTPVEVAGEGFLRVDVPGPTAGDDGPWQATQVYSPKAVYCLTPTTREVAVRAAQSCRPEPVSRWDYPALAAGETVDPVPPDEDPGEWDDEPEF